MSKKKKNEVTDVTNVNGATEQPVAAEVAQEKAPGKIAQILELFKSGKTNKEIQELGFHPTTISIQISKYKKANPDLYPPKAPALTKEQKKELREKEKAEKQAAKVKESPVANNDVVPVVEFAG